MYCSLFIVRGLSSHLVHIFFLLLLTVIKKEKTDLGKGTVLFSAMGIVRQSKTAQYGNGRGYSTAFDTSVIGNVRQLFARFLTIVGKARQRK